MRRFNFICPDTCTHSRSPEVGAEEGPTRQHVDAPPDAVTKGHRRPTHATAAARRRKRDQWQLPAALLAALAAWLAWGLAISAEDQLGRNLTWPWLLVTTVLPAALSIGALLFTALQSPAAPPPELGRAVTRQSTASATEATGAAEGRLAAIPRRGWGSFHLGCRPRPGRGAAV